jgi:hypothetical protein
MGKRIFKYEVPVADRFTVEMPTGAELLAVQMQHDRPVFWALVDDNHNREARTFYVVGTGNRVPAGAEIYVGTWQSGPFVWHLFTGHIGDDT